jgi:hypothetical protein
MLFVCAIILTLLTYDRLHHPKSVAAQSADTVTLRVVFGYERTTAKTYDGSLRVIGGVLHGIEPWRFLQGDAITVPNSWKLQIRRITFENSQMPRSRWRGDLFRRTSFRWGSS